MSELNENNCDIPNCVIINLTKLELGLVRGATCVSPQQLINASAIKYDVIIVITDTNSDLPSLASQSGIKILISSKEIESAIFKQQHDFYNGIIHCEPALTTELLKDLVEPITAGTLICFEIEDLRLFFSVNKVPVNYQRFPIAKDTCPPFIIAKEHTVKYKKMDALLILTCNLNTKMELVQDINRKIAESENITTKGLATRGVEYINYEHSDHHDSQALGILSITLP